METLAEAGDEGIDLDGIDVGGAVAQGGGDVIACAGPDDEDVVDALRKLEGAVVGTLLVGGGEGGMRLKVGGGDIGDGHVPLVVDVDLVILVGERFDGELLVGRPVDGVFGLGDESDDDHGEQSAGDERGTQRDRLTKKNEREGDGKPPGGREPEKRQSGEQPDSDEAAEEIDGVSRDGVGGGFEVIADPAAERDHGDGEQDEEDEDDEEGERKDGVVGAAVERELLAPERGV